MSECRLLFGILVKVPGQGENMKKNISLLKTHKLCRNLTGVKKRRIRRNEKKEEEEEEEEVAVNQSSRLILFQERGSETFTF